MSIRREDYYTYLDDNAVVGDAGHLDAGIGDVLDGTGGARHGLDADRVCRVNNLRVLDDDVGDIVVIAAADGTDRETMATCEVALVVDPDMHLEASLPEQYPPVKVISDPELMAKQSSWLYTV